MKLRRFLVIYGYQNSWLYEIKFNILFNKGNLTLWKLPVNEILLILRHTVKKRVSLSLAVNVIRTDFYTLYKSELLLPIIKFPQLPWFKLFLMKYLNIKIFHALYVLQNCKWVQNSCGIYLWLKNNISWHVASRSVIKSNSL